nr:hypothetical protein CFP56_24801 [Quercus suber]
MWKEYKVQDNHANIAVKKVAVNSEEEITEVINALENSILEMVEVLTDSNSGNNGENNSRNYGDIYGNNGDTFEDQILEIDRELNSVDISERIERDEAANNK